MNEVLHQYREQKAVSLLTNPEDLVEYSGWGWGQGCETGPAPLSQQGAEQVLGRGGKNPSAGLDLLSDASRGWKGTGAGSKHSASDVVLFQLVTQSQTLIQGEPEGNPRPWGDRGCVRAHTEPVWSQAQSPLGSEWPGGAGGGWGGVAQAHRWPRPGPLG